MEVILGFTLGVLASYWFLIGIFICAIWAEAVESHQFAAFYTILALVSGYLIFSLSPLYLAAYIPVGILWSFWRWKVHCKKALFKAKEGILSNGPWAEYDKLDTATSRRNLEKAIDLKSNVDKIVSWIICFPASMLEQFVGDLVHVLRTAVTEWLASIYTKVSNNTLEIFDKDKD